MRVGAQIFVSGTTAVDEGGRVVGHGDAYAQAKRCFAIIADALEQAGSNLDEVVRTRMYVTQISDWEAVGRAHGETFGQVRPATSLIEVSGLIDPDMLVEIEVEAVAGDRS
jgi:enamine deaminase RidA (YjgF/YER057c/UK114 family)